MPSHLFSQNFERWSEKNMKIFFYQYCSLSKIGKPEIGGQNKNKILFIFFKFCSEKCLNVVIFHDFFHICKKNSVEEDGIKNNLEKNIYFFS